MITLGLYGVVLFFFWRLYRSVQRKRTFYLVLAVCVLALVGLYVPTAIQVYNFQQKSAMGGFKQVGTVDLGLVEGIYFPHLTCTDLCMDLLLSRQVRFVETKAAMVQKADRSFEKLKEPFVRWTLADDRSYCWTHQNAVRSIGTTLVFNRGLLAQGVCFVWQPEEELTSQLRVSFTYSRELTGKTRHVESIDTEHELLFVANGTPRTIATNSYRAERILAFPPRVGMTGQFIGVFLPTGFTVIHTMISYGIPTVEQFMEKAAGLKMPAKPSYAGPLLDANRLAVIDAAVKAEEPVVRWSAASAICGLKNDHPRRFDAQIDTLRHDRNNWVRAAAEQAYRQRPGVNLCGLSASFVNGQRLDGALFNEKAANMPIPYGK